LHQRTTDRTFVMGQKNDGRTWPRLFLLQRPPQNHRVEASRTINISDRDIEPDNLMVFCQLGNTCRRFRLNVHRSFHSRWRFGMNTRRLRLNSRLPFY
jgi:hypothetical protein